MAAKAFIKASVAAEIGGVTVAQLGCSSGNEFPTKGGLVNSGGSFNLSRLSSYDDDDFVLENDVVLGELLVELQMRSDVASRGNVQLDNGTVADSVAVVCNQGQVVTAHAIIDDSADIFLGWYDKNNNLVSSLKDYTFTVQSDISLTAYVAYLDVNVNELNFGYSAGEAEIEISSNLGWVIE